MEYTLENGKKLIIKGKKFIVEIQGDSILVEPVSDYTSVSVTTTGLDDVFNAFDKPAISKEPAKVVSYSEIQSKAKQENDDWIDGHDRFKDFIEEWSEGFGITNAEQPDRAKILNEYMTYHSKNIFKFIKQYGGLTHAIFVVQDDSDINDSDDRMHNRLLAENIAQVSSILYPPLSETLEYPFKVN